MPNRPGNDDRITADGENDRGGQRDASSVGVRQNGSQSGAQARSRSNRGFASMDRDKQKEIASKGGKAAHAKGTAHEFDSGEAREAGRKGGVAVSRNREHMAAIGRRGGEARGQSRGHGPSQGNTAGSGSNQDGSYQNSRNGSANSTNSTNSTNGADRQVAISNQHEGVNANPQGNRGGSTPLGGERRPNTGNNALGSNDSSTRGESFGNH